MAGICTLPEQDKLQATDSKVTDPGFTSFLNKIPKDEISALSRIPDGTHQFSLSGPAVTEHQTTPPKRYTQASLIKDMCQVSKYASDPRIRQLFLTRDAESKNSGSIGTAATRDSIVKALIEKSAFLEEYQEGKGRYIRSTDKGRAFFDLLPSQLKSLDTTVLWWEITQEIQKGNKPVEALTDSVLDQVKEFLLEPPKLKEAKGLPETVTGKTVVGTCPRCGKQIVEGKKGYGCLGYKDDPPCSFIIWKTSKLLETGNKTVTPEMARSLLRDGKCGIDGLISKTGKKYGGILELKDDDEKVNLEFRFRTEEEQSVGPCPRCGRPVTENAKGFGCSGYRDPENQCRFFLSKDPPILAKNRKKLTVAMAKKLLSGKTCHITGLTSGSGSKYSADFILKDNGTYANLEMVQK